MKIILLVLFMSTTCLLMASTFEDRLREILKQGENEAKIGYTMFRVKVEFSSKEEAVMFLAEASVMFSAVRSKVVSEDLIIRYHHRLEGIDYICASWFDPSRDHTYQDQKNGKRYDQIRNDTTSYMVIRVNDIQNRLKWDEYGDQPIQQAYEVAMVQVVLLAKNISGDELYQGKF